MDFISKDRDLSLIQMTSLLIVLNKKPSSISVLSSTLRTTPHVILYELQILQNAGFPIVQDKTTKDWTLLSDYGVPRIDFTLNEILSVLLLFLQYGDRIEDKLFTTLRSAIFKLAGAISPNFMEKLMNIQPKFAFKNFPKETENNQEIFQTFFEAVEQKRVVKIDYQSPADSGPIRTLFHPYSLYCARSWYIIGYAVLFREIRTFKINRVLNIDVLQETFDKPQFSVDEYFGNAWNFIREGDRDYHIRIRFSPKVAQNVSEIHWHRTQKKEWEDDGSVVLTFDVCGLNEIFWWILGYGAEAKVLEPEELQNKIREEISKAQKIYE
ncbi:MAG: WYL domain-containing protein [Planctomycetia bacterium]|nr:WYL domain-containing protein [Planctomycetia bacterium]